MTIRLIIDDIDYTSKIVDEPNGNFKIHFQAESDYNSPATSIANFTLYNDVNLQNIFLNNSPFSLFQEGEVKIYLNELSSSLIFHGYIDKDSAPEDLNTKDIEITAFGYDKLINNSLKNYDITQLYYELGSDNRRRGAKTTAQRFSINDYISIEDLIKQMFDDLGYNYLVNVPNSSYFKYKYNSDKYGEPTDTDYSVLRSRNTFGRYSKPFSKSLGNATYIGILSYFADRITKSDETSYQTLLKDWSALTGAINFYEYYSEKMIVIPRDYDFTLNLGKSVVDVSSFIMEEGYEISYHSSYGGLKINCSDIQLGITKDFLIPGGRWIVGAGTNSGSKLLILTSGTYNAVLVEGGSNSFNMGATIDGTFDPALFIPNAFEVDLNDELVSYLNPGLDAGDSVKDFIEACADNYDFLMSKGKGQRLKLKGLFSFPQRILYEGSNINVFDLELDILKEETEMRFEY